MNTMAEGLTSLITTIAQLKLTPDADVQFLNDLEAQIATKVREAQAAELAGQASQFAPAGPAGGGADMLGSIMPGPGAAPIGSMGPPPMPGGGMPMPGPGMGPMMGGAAPAPPNADELRRTLSL